MDVLGGIIATVILLGLTSVTAHTFRGKWRQDAALFDGSPRVVVPHQGGPTRAEHLAELAAERGYTRMYEWKADSPADFDLVFVLQDNQAA